MDIPTFQAQWCRGFEYDSTHASSTSSRFCPICRTWERIVKTHFRPAPGHTSNRWPKRLPKIQLDWLTDVRSLQYPSRNKKQLSYSPSLLVQQLAYWLRLTDLLARSHQLYQAKSKPAIAILPRPRASCLHPWQYHKEATALHISSVILQQLLTVKINWLNSFMDVPVFFLAQRQYLLVFITTT
jgi:hypothetical protein